MQKKFTLEEQELIQELGNKESPNIDRVAELLMSKIGDMSFNARLKKDKSPTNISAKQFLQYFTYKTKGAEQFSFIASKLGNVLTLKEKQLPIEDHEKVTLAEFSKILNLKSIDDKYEGWLRRIDDNCNDVKFHELYSNIRDSSAILNQLSQGALEPQNYQSGDLMMSLISKHVKLTGRQQGLGGHGGKLEEAFITKYLHAAPLNIDSSDPTKPLVIKSEISSTHQIQAVSLEDILISDTLRVDPTKLISKKHVKMLEGIDYGYKQDSSGNSLIDKNGNKTKVTWQEVIKDRYEQLSNALHTHTGQMSQGITQHIKLLKERSEEVWDEREELLKQIKLYHQEYDEFNALHNRMNKMVTLDVNSDEYNYLASKKEGYEYLKDKIQAGKSEYQQIKNAFDKKDAVYNQLAEEVVDKASELIRLDPERLGANHWLSPKTIFKGHDQWLSKSDFRDLSQKMYNASPDQKLMLCSEFAARSIASTIDQLNRITAVDLQAAGVIDKEEKIIKNPISKKENFDNLHPERLVQILKKSGGVEKIENKFLKDLIQLESPSKAKTKKVERVNSLPQKIYKLLRTSENVDIFKDKALKELEEYLREVKVEDNVIKDARESILNYKLDDVYKKYKERPKGVLKKIKAACVKIATKDAKVKKNLKTIVDGITKDSQIVQKEESQPNIISEAEAKQQAINIGKGLLANNVPQEVQPPIKSPQRVPILTR
jgi:hypothetical protein